MQTTDQIIDEILLKSPYGAKAYEARQKRQRGNEIIEDVEDEVVDHPHQMFIDFGDIENVN
ncbi:TPA: hypothetical protein EYP45_00450 [Candidatus Peregrinibacteria bacterium]|nr:hypothetical protein [Candidatus Peregrinibacteria bacterium]